MPTGYWSEVPPLAMLHSHGNIVLPSHPGKYSAHDVDGFVQQFRRVGRHVTCPDHRLSLRDRRGYDRIDVDACIEKLSADQESPRIVMGEDGDDGCFCFVERNPGFSDSIPHMVCC